MSETVDYNGVIQYTDRLNYVSPLINNMGYCMAVEKLLGVSVPERCHYVRVILSEISRISDHLTCVGATAMELGAFNVFLYMIKAREYLWELVEKVTGARLTVTYCRVGGVKADLPEDFAEPCHKAFEETRKVIDEANGLLTRNRIFTDRMNGTGVISEEDAISYGITGPFLRASGGTFDVRKDCPYAVYDRLPFDVPVGTRGDNMDRYLVRMEENGSSRCASWRRRCATYHPGSGSGQPREPDVRFRRRSWWTLPRWGTSRPSQADARSPGQPSRARVARSIRRSPPTRSGSFFLPRKTPTATSRGSCSNSSSSCTATACVRPKGEVYLPVEGANGELGLYVVSDGAGNAYRVRVRPPCFAIMSALPQLLKGGMMADMVPTFGSVNMIGGELDR